MPFDLSKFKKNKGKVGKDRYEKDEKKDKKGKKKMTSPSANFMKRFEAAK